MAHVATIGRLAPARCARQGLAVYSGAAKRRFYGLFATTAALGANVLVIETQLAHHAEWSDFLREAAPNAPFSHIMPRGGLGMNASAETIARAFGFRRAGREYTGKCPSCGYKTGFAVTERDGCCSTIVTPAAALNPMYARRCNGPGSCRRRAADADQAEASINLSEEPGRSLATN